MGRHLDLAAVTSEAARMFPVIVRADASALILADSNGEFYCAAQTGLNSSCSTAISHLAKHLITSSHLGKGQLYSTADLTATLSRLSLKSLDLLPARALLAIPIHRKDLIHGVLFAIRFSAIDYNSGTLQIAMIYAEQISASIENAILYQAVQNELAERERLEEEQRKWERQQQQLQKTESLNRMAGAIAHHFNNMLGAVMGNLELAIMDLPPGPTVETLNDAMKASRGAAEVSSLMLTYLGQSAAKRESLDFSEICRKSLSLLQVAAPRNITFKVDLPSPGPTIIANESQIQQVIANLITNAWEAANENQGIIVLTLRSLSPDGIPAAHRFPVDWQSQDRIYACLKVSDRGCGISEQNIEKLFDPFFSSKFTGRGLGLAIVLGIVKAHDGAVTVESKAGQETTFQVFLPVSGEAVSLQRDMTAPPLGTAEGGTVLLVEDMEILRDMVATMLMCLGFKVLTAKDGIEAVEIFQQSSNEIQVVLSDLSMPRMNGWETLSALRRIRPDIPVILTSGYDEAQVIAGAHTELPQAFLHKPYQMAMLKDALAKAMKG